MGGDDKSAEIEAILETVDGDPESADDYAAATAIHRQQEQKRLFKRPLKAA